MEISCEIDSSSRKTKKKKKKKKKKRQQNKEDADNLLVPSERELPASDLIIFDDNADGASNVPRNNSQSNTSGKEEQNDVLPQSPDICVSENTNQDERKSRRKKKKKKKSAITVTLSDNSDESSTEDNICLDNKSSAPKYAFVNPKNAENEAPTQQKSIAMETKSEEICCLQDLVKKKKRKRDSTVADLSIDIDVECSIKKRSHKKRKRSSSKNTIDNFGTEEAERISATSSAENVGESLSVKPSKKRMRLSSDINNDNCELLSGLNNAENRYDTEKHSGCQDTTRTSDETVHKKAKRKRNVSTAGDGEIITNILQPLGLRDNTSPRKKKKKKRSKDKGKYD